MTAERPNILWITWHDLGRHLGCYGKTHGASPNLDRLAADGLCFERFFATNPICSPSRGSLVTGKYPQRNGLEGLVNRGARLNPGEKTAEDYLKAAGYRTALVGYQHERPRVEEYPCDIVWSGPLPRGKLAENVTPVVCETLRGFAGGEGPFYLRTGFYEVHRPLLQEEVDESMPVDPLPYLPDSPELRRQLRQYQQLIARADRAFGRIRQTLKETGFDRNTLVVFTTDHGIPFPRSKGTLYDSGLGIAVLMYHPELACGGRRIRGLISGVDLLPTVLDLAGITPSGADFDGRSLRDLIGGRTEDGRAHVFGHRAPKAPRRCVRSDRYKYIVNFDETMHIQQVDIEITRTDLLKTLPDAMRDQQPMEELYDLSCDPDELTNVARDPGYADALSELRGVLRGWMARVDDPLLRGSLETPHFARTMKTLFLREPPPTPVSWL